MNDRYKVMMDITTTDDGTPHYKIVEVLEFAPAEQQIGMALRPGGKKKASKKRA
jgi:hypothetical protein